MRWPFITKAGTRRSIANVANAATASNAAIAGPPVDAPADIRRGGTAGAPPVAAPVADASRPRADWARLSPLATASSASPALTFHGERFGRSVAGARPIIATPRTPPRHLAPVGLVLDLAHVDAVSAAPPPEVPDPAARTSSAPAPPVHRRPVAPARRTTALTAGDHVVQLAPIEPRHRAGAAAPPTATSWDIEHGFRTDDDDSERFSTRVVRRRGDGAPDTTSTSGEQDDGTGDEPDAPAQVPGDRVAQVRYLPDAAPTPDIERAPADLVAIVRHATGIDVGDVVIDRSPAVTARAGDIGAIAFTEHGRVNVPAELGPLDATGTRPIVAHELTHVAQQRRLADVPPERTPDGAHLEREARDVERMAAGGTTSSVTPLFLRSRTSMPPAAPLGVQRRSPDDWAGADWSTTDLSDVAPGSDDDPFRWQERDGEPTEVAWPERQAWAKDFETANALRLQTVRDDRYQELVHAATTSRPDGDLTADLTADEDDAIREQIDAELPWQFGSPAGLTDAPRVVPVLPATAPGSLPSAQAVSPAALGPAALTELRFPTTPSRPDVPDAEPDRQRAAPVAGATTVVIHTAAPAEAPLTIDPAVVRSRHERERELRHSLLLQKRQVLIDAGAHDDAVVSLTGDEIDRIRFIVDLEQPAGDAPVEYLGLDDDASVTVAGRLGGIVDDDAPATAWPQRNARAATDDEATDADAAMRASAGEPGQADLQLSPVAGRTGAEVQPDPFAVDDTSGHTRDDGEELDPFAAWEAMEAQNAGATSAIDGAELGEAQGHARHPAIDGDAHADAELAARVVDSLSEVDLELLTRRMYRRLRTMLRSELLIDRERAGSLADIR